MGEIAKGFGLLGGMSSSQEKGGLQLYGGFFDKNPVPASSFTFPGIVNNGSARVLAGLTSNNWGTIMTFPMYHNDNITQEKELASYKLAVSQDTPGTLSGATLHIYTVTTFSATNCQFVSILSKSLDDWPGGAVITTLTGGIGITPPRNKIIAFGIRTPSTTIPNLAYALTINFSTDLV